MVPSRIAVTAAIWTGRPRFAAQAIMAMLCAPLAHGRELSV